VNETKSHLAIGKKEFVDGDGKGLAGADDQGRKYERIANARAITAMSPPFVGSHSLLPYPGYRA
jgi:hypothetical protein